MSVHQRSLHLLRTDIYKTINNLNPYFVGEIIVTNIVPYNPRDSTNSVLTKARTKQYGIDTVRLIGQKLWQALPGGGWEGPKHWQLFEEILSP